MNEKDTLESSLRNILMAHYNLPNMVIESNDPEDLKITLETANLAIKNEKIILSIISKMEERSALINSFFEEFKKQKIDIPILNQYIEKYEQGQE